MTSRVEGPTRPLVLVTVGTDHHPFDRLVSWAEAWQRNGGSGEARILMQIGTSRTPDRVAWVTYLAHDDLERLMTEAAAIVCHGGPGTIIASLSAGKMPIVVPRTHALGEHVDDHQVRFAGRLEQLGYAFVAEERARFEYLLTQAISGASGFIAPQLQARTARSVEAFGQVIEERLNISPRNASPR